jgi:alkanesulfonate monooxygenase SsuD/methylene tetrahydromethanopterin reductase-like flavin-dependent oxidoreductase (luciferase family)
MRLGTCILIVPQRNPLVLAKELATLDQLSGGRVELGLGVGWLEGGVRRARRAVGSGAVPATTSTSPRCARCGPAPRSEFHGEFVDFPKVTCSPRPCSRRSRSWSAATATRRSGAQSAWPTATSPARATSIASPRLIARVRDAAERAGRDPDEIEINAMFSTRWPTPRRASRGSPNSASAGSWCRRSSSPATGGLDRMDEFAGRAIAAGN